MNERIKQLYSQAGLTLNNPLAYEQWYLDSLEKFADLLIQECLTICDKEKAEYQKFRQGTDDFDEKNIYAEGEVAAASIKYRIKHLFGVKNV